MDLKTQAGVSTGEKEYVGTEYSIVGASFR